MKLRKNINKRMISISVVLLGALLLLTGCGRADITVRTYDKENEESVKNVVKEENTIINDTNNVENNTTTGDEKKDENKVEKNEATKLSEILSRDWLEDFSSQERANKKVRFNKLSIYGKDIYVVIIEDGGSHNTMYLIGKDNNGYVVKKALENEQSDIQFDMSNQNMFVVESLAEYTTELYAINADSLTVQKFAESAINPNDGEEYWYVNDENVSYGRYYSYFDEDNLKSISTWSLLTKENINKIVK